jgi:hypothetical protein
VTTGNPAEHIDLLGVGQAVGDGVGNELQQRVSAEILEVVDVRLHLDAVHPIDLLGVLLVERELDVRLAELDLLETARRGRLWIYRRSRRNGPARATRPTRSH